MDQATWNTLTPAQRERERDYSSLHPQLIGNEGWRVEIIDADGERQRFIVGRSTGWVPVHLAIARRDSTGGPAVDSRPYRRVRRLYRVR